MKRLTVVMLTIALCASSAFAQDSPAALGKAKKPKLTRAQKMIWASTAGTVASGSPASRGDAEAARSAHEADVAAGATQPSDLASSIPNEGCPEGTTTTIAEGTEVPIIQGTASAPAGTTAQWSFRGDSTAYLIGSNDEVLGGRSVHIKGYIGVPSSPCSDFNSCKSQLSAVDVTDVLVLPQHTFNGPPIQTIANVVQQQTGLDPSATLVLFITATPSNGDILCASGTLAPIINAQ